MTAIAQSTGIRRLFAWRTPTYLHALVTTAPVVPTLAVLTALAAYLVGSHDAKTFGVGTVVIIPVWLVAALVFQCVGTAERMSPSNYDKLYARLTELHACVRTLCVDKPSRSANCCPACIEAREHLCFVDQQLRAGIVKSTPADQQARCGPQNNLRWLLATGYSDLWARLHRAEEALIAVVPTANAFAMAIEDEQRLEGSNIPNLASLLKNLRRAADDLDHDAAQRYLDQPPSQRQPPSQAGAALIEAEARNVIQATRRVINEFRDSRFDGMIQARNRLYQTGMFTALIAYVLLGVAIVEKSEPQAVAAAAVFYLVGALTGLFNRLGSETDADSATEDYGLSAVRLLYTPLFCGLAALGGVMIVALIPNFVPADGSGGQGGTLPELVKIFDLHGNQAGLVVSAVFGLTPNLLINRLKQQTDRYKGDIKSVEASSPR